VGKSSTDAAVADLRRQLQEGSSRTAILQTQLEVAKKKAETDTGTLLSDLESRTAEASDLKQKLDKASQDAAGLRNRQKALLDQQAQLIRQFNDAEALATQSKTRADQLQEQLTRTSQSLQAYQTEVGALQNRVRALESMKQPVPPVPAPVRWGSIVWKGKVKRNENIRIDGDSVTAGELVRGKFPGTPCEILVGYPDGLSVNVRPSAQNQWKRLEFSSKNAGDVTAVFFWVGR
jgi:hypothetical protein